MTVVIREAKKEDAATILDFIKELAIYEKAEHEVVATVADIEKHLFSESATNYGLMCLLNDKPIGFAVYFLSFSTWLGKTGIYLEDLYVSPEYRGIGAGKALLKQLAKIAVDNNHGRFEWSVLDWNTPAIDFYESVGAKAKTEWLGYRLEGQALKDFANS